MTAGGTLSIIAASSNLSSPSGVAVDGSGNVYIADTSNQVVEKVTPGGSLSIIAGNGNQGAPTPGPATNSDLSSPSGVATDSSGNVYIADQGNQRVEEVTPTGTLSIIAGTGNQGPPTPGPATSSNLHSPAAVAADRYGNLYIADLGNSDVEEVFGVTSVELDPTATSVSCAPTAFSAGAATACTAAVSDTAASGLVTPTGNVSFASSPSSGTFTGSGACQLTAKLEHWGRVMPGLVHALGTRLLHGDRQLRRRQPAQDKPAVHHRRSAAATEPCAARSRVDHSAARGRNRPQPPRHLQGSWLVLAATEIDCS